MLSNDLIDTIHQCDFITDREMAVATAELVESLASDVYSEFDNSETTEGSSQ